MSPTSVHRVDALVVVKQLAAGRSLDFVTASNPHLTREQVRQIAQAHGYPDAGKLAWAVDVLAKQIAQADVDSIEAARHETRGPATKPGEPAQQQQPRLPPPVRTATHPSGATMTAQPAARPVQQIGQPMRTYEATAMLLLEGKESASKRTQALAEKIEDLLVDLRDRIRGEAEAKQAASRREAERRAALEEVRRAEEALKAARDKARRFKNTPGGVGRATTVRSPSSDSRRPGGLASIDANRTAGTTRLREVLDRFSVRSGDIRKWAWENGIQCSGTGKLPNSVLDAYVSAHDDTEVAG